MTRSEPERFVQHGCRSLLRRCPCLVVGLVMVLQGCAGVSQDRQEASAPSEVPRSPDNVLVRKGRPGLVIGAPHGTPDKDTGRIASDLAAITGFGLVVMQVPSQADLS